MLGRMTAAAPGLLVATSQSASAETFAISFRWCAGSSEITLHGVPKGTATLDARMIDRWVPGYDHGGGKVAYTGAKTIPCGAIADFRGPAPPAGQVHDYEWTVRALAADGGVSAVAEAVRKVSEK